MRSASYLSPDGSVLGDPQNVDFTSLVRSLGWSPPTAPGAFDLLLLVIQAGGALAMRQLLWNVVLEVRLAHPDNPWFEKLGLRWHAVPAISDMMMVTLDEVFPCAPFNMVIGLRPDWRGGGGEGGRMSRSGFVLTRLPDKRASRVVQDAGFGAGGSELQTLPAEEPDLSEYGLANNRRLSGASQRGANSFPKKGCRPSDDSGSPSAS